MPIRILPPDVANKIAAGEVVERPASAVKELVENALDAGATQIRVEIVEGGIRRIKVVDNGSGIPPDELPLAVQRHATSKIASAADLAAIRTLGFRGEALAAIAAVSRLTITSRPAGVPAGRQIVVEGGRLLREGTAAHPQGTTVIVEHLFFNTPARRKFLKAPRTEAAYIHRVVSRYAFAFPEVRFELISNAKLVLQTAGNGKLLDVVAAVWGPEAARAMLTVGDVDQPWPEPGPEPRVWGLVSRPEHTRASMQQIHLFVNRRWITDKGLIQAVLQAYHALIPAGRYPMALIFIALDPTQVDVNVHPTKAEVRFRDPRLVFTAVQRAVRAALAGSPVAKAIPAAGKAEPAEWAARRSQLVDAGQGSGLSLWTGQDVPAGEEEVPAARQLLPILRVVGQVAATYIVAEGPDGLYLIDQHAAHERVLYERLLEEWQTRGTLASQQLLEPVPVTLSREQGQWLVTHKELLARAGFDVEAFGTDTYLVRAVPAVLAQRHPERALEEFLEALREHRDLVGETVEERLILHICKAAAVKAGQVLSEEEMRALVRDLEACTVPYTCPHGRPTLIHISASDLARQFGRSG